MPDMPDSQEDHAAHDAEHTMSQTADTAHDTADQARVLGEEAAEAGSDAAHHGVKFAEDLADKSRENFAHGMRALADAYAPMAEAGEDARRRLMETSSRVSEAYADAADQGAEDVQALTSSYLQLGRGLLRLQQGYLNAVQQSLSEVKHQPHDLLACKSVAEFAGMQRSIYLDGVNLMIQSSTALMELAGKAVQDANGPLQARVAEHA